MLGAVGTVWLPFIGTLFSVVICCCFLVFVRVGFPSEVTVVCSFVVRGEEALKELSANVVFPTRTCWCSEPSFFCFFIELGAHGVGARGGGSVLWAFSFTV
jgi:hypothetical protein